MLRLSALIGLYKSLELYFNEADLAGVGGSFPTGGPEFDGARPVDADDRRGIAQDPARAELCRRVAGRSLRITSVNDRALVRLISETHHKPAVLRGLVDSDEEAAILAGVEGETSARLIAEREGRPRARPPRTGLRAGGPMT